MIHKVLSVVVSFNKTIDAMNFEEYCLKHKVSGRLIPLPKEISAGCGLAWKCELNQKSEIKNALNILKIEYEKIVEIVI